MLLEGRTAIEALHRVGVMAAVLGAVFLTFVPAQASPANLNTPTCADLVLKDSDNAKGFEPPVGQVIHICLKGNPTTGYLWAVSGVDGASVRQVGKIQYRPDKKPAKVVGSGGVFTATFKTVDVGWTTVTFEYRRPWEKDTAPARTFVVYLRGMTPRD